MKRLLAVVSGPVLLLGVLFSGGCNDELEQVKQLNRNVNDQLNKCKDELRLAQADNERLKGELTDRDRTLRAQADQITLLTGTNNSLTAALEEMKKRLRDSNSIFVALPKPLHELLMKFAKDYPDILTYYPESGMVKFNGDPTFDPGSVTIKPAALAALKKFAEILNTTEARPFNIYIAGHTDDIPLVKPETVQKYGNNWGLSAFRALAVVKTLYDDQLDQERMAAVAFSLYHPIAPNAAGHKGNVMNRRVEIWIVPNTTLLSQPPGIVPPSREEKSPG